LVVGGAVLLHGVGEKVGLDLAPDVHLLVGIDQLKYVVDGDVVDCGLAVEYVVLEFGKLVLYLVTSFLHEGELFDGNLHD